MKKGLLICLSMAFGLGVFAQGVARLPQGFRKAEVPAALKSRTIKAPYRVKDSDLSGVPLNNLKSRRYAGPESHFIHSDPTAYEYLVGYSYYDLQTNASASSRIIYNDDNTVAVAWTFSPDDIQTPSLFPNRGTGYNYSTDGGDTWQFPTVIGVQQGPSARTESTRTGFTNIVNTSSGSEMSISHGTSPTGMTLNYRPAKGTGAWTLSYPWGTGGNDTWAKTASDGDNVYAIWQGSGTTNTPVDGQDGPIYFTKSTDGGVTWSTKSVLTEIDSTYYLGFGGDEYGIDAYNHTVAIVVGSQMTDLVLLKSTDDGATWTKTIIYQHPIPMYDLNTQISDTNGDGTVDTLTTPCGDNALLIDNNGMVHVWFSDFRWYCDLSTPGSYNYFPSTDGLEYWNENMATGGFVMIAAAEDLNGNGELDVPLDETCSGPGLAWGNYRGGLTQMPSAGIERSTGNIYVSYQTIDELADTALWHQAHRHIYVIGTYDGGANWTTPIDIVPSIAMGGDGENQEAVFATMAKNVVSGLGYVVYQRDPYPGSFVVSNTATTTCDYLNNIHNTSDIVFARVNVNWVGVDDLNNENMFVSQNYPNPATSSTSIRVTLKKSADIVINITDILGKTVYSQTISDSPAGTREITINTADWNSGVYSYTVTSGSQRSSQTMIVK